MQDSEDIQVSFYENFGEEPRQIATEVEDETGREETQSNIIKRPRSCWQAVLIGILMLLFCGATAILFSQRVKLQLIQDEIFTMRNKTNLFKKENNLLKQLLNSTYPDLNLLGNQYDLLKLLINANLYNFTLSPENINLSRLLDNKLQEKKKLEVENKKLNAFLNSALENYNLVHQRNGQLNLLLNESLHIIVLASEEMKELHLMLDKERQKSMQLEAENQHQRSILSLDELSFLWRFCNKTTLQCSRCSPGWAVHTSRCFFLSKEAKTWEEARSDCHVLGGDLAVVLNAEDQEFLTNMTVEFVQHHPQENFHSAWIGLRNMVREGTFIWVNGNRVKSDVIYWRHMEPNNNGTSWDKDQAGQDCVGIVPPRQVGEMYWLNSWDDIVCDSKQHYLCETLALSLS
uniref:low affinity immunoglobulin epsilon Fc receptor-like n=1 Tax=Scatophagus argus TaxID=75038 RepID=UPI001ED82089|nr:low affinity immunoglobulin epsilon Fc receptor-like [Scatophagus argus]